MVGVRRFGQQRGGARVDAVVPGAPFELFGQRQTRYAKWLLSCDRIGLDCYRVSYLGLGVARPIPAPPPFSYMATGFAPATFRSSSIVTRGTATS